MLNRASGHRRLRITSVPPQPNAPSRNLRTSVFLFDTIVQITSTVAVRRAARCETETTRTPRAYVSHRIDAGHEISGKPHVFCRRTRSSHRCVGTTGVSAPRDIVITFVFCHMEEPVHPLINLWRWTRPHAFSAQPVFVPRAATFCWQERQLCTAESRQ